MADSNSRGNKMENNIRGILTFKITNDRYYIYCFTSWIQEADVVSISNNFIQHNPDIPIYVIGGCQCEETGDNWDEFGQAHAELLDNVIPIELLTNINNVRAMHPYIPILCSSKHRLGVVFFNNTCA